MLHVYARVYMLPLDPTSIDLDVSKNIRLNLSAIPLGSGVYADKQI